MSDLKQQKQNQPENGSLRYQDEAQNEVEPQIEVAAPLPTAQLEQPQLRTPQTILRMQGLIGNRATQQFIGLQRVPKPIQRQKPNEDTEESEQEESEPVAEEKLSQAGADEPPPGGDDDNNGAGSGSNDGAGNGTGSGANGGTGNGQPNGNPFNKSVSPFAWIHPVATPTTIARTIQRTPDSGASTSPSAPTSGGNTITSAPTPTGASNTGGGNAGGSAAGAGGGNADSQPTTAANGASSPTGSGGGLSASPTSAGGSSSAPTGGNDRLNTPAPDGGGEAGSGLFSPEAVPETDVAGLSTVKQEAKAAGTAYADLPEGAENVGDARGAVTEPTEETKGRAEGDLMADLASEPGPSPEILELCDRIREVIRNKRPPDEDSLVDTEPDEVAKEAGKELNTSLEDKTKTVQDGYQEMEGTPSGQAEQTGGTVSQIPENPSGVPQMNTDEAVPEPVSSEDVSLDAEVEEQEENIDAALEGKEETAELVESGPVAEMREGKDELKKTAEEDPAEVLKKHQEILANTRASMQELQQQALSSLEAVRAGTRVRMQSQKGDMVESEEQTRARVGEQANQIYENAQKQVTALIEKVPEKAMERWEAGVKVHSHNFKTRLSEVAKYIEERHEGVVGAITSVGDSVFGLPDWITDEYNSAEQAFGDGVCDLLKEISTEVNGIVRTCQQIIQEARQQIHELFAELPADMQKWAAQQQAQFDDRLNSLNQKVLDTRNNFNKQLTTKAAQAVQDARQEVHALREKAKGLIQKIADAINAFLEDPAKFIINGLLELLGIAASAFWAVVNKIQSAIDFIAEKPMEFANNLVNALSKGFQKFFDNFATHLMDGLFTWLFSRLSDVGVQAPTDFTPKSILTFFMQVMGFTWERLKKILTKIIGAENMELIEQAWDLLSMLIEKGPEGIFDLIADALDPKKIIDTIIDTAIQFVVETLIKQVALRLLGMLNPAGAIIQAIEIIYKVMSWIFENASKIFSLIETIVGGISNIIAGNIGGIAASIETALAKLLPIVIDFLADLLGLGGLPGKVAKAIGKIQDFVEKAITEALEFIAKKAKSLLKKLGFGGDDDKKAGEKSDYDGQIGKRVKWESDEKHEMWIVDQGGSVNIMMASDNPGQIGDALDSYKDQAGDVQEKDKKDKILGDIKAARTLLKAIEKQAQKVAKLQDSSKADKKQLKDADDELESQQDELRTKIAGIQKALGLNKYDEYLPVVKKDFGKRKNFSTQEFYRDYSGITVGESRRKQLKAEWQSLGAIFEISSSANDAYKLLTFDPIEAGSRETNPDNRNKYGYVNLGGTHPDKLKILSKNRGDPYGGIDWDNSVVRKGMVKLNIINKPDKRLTTEDKRKAAESPDFHESYARYISARGDYSRPFSFADAIQGHGEKSAGYSYDGASGHWNEKGHKQERDKNTTWNQDPKNYWGPEHRSESNASGGKAPRYLVPHKDIKSHKSWWE